MSPQPPNPSAIHPIGVATFDCVRDNVVKPWVVRWGSLASRLQRFAVRPDVTDKRDLPLWCPATFRAPTRSTKAVDDVTCLVFDYDDGTPLERAIAPWDGYAAAWYSTWSHTPDRPRFRLVFPLDIPIPGERWADAWRWAAEVANGIDPTCKNPDRIYCLPAVQSEDSPRFAGARAGALLRMSFRDPPAPVVPPRSPNRPVYGGSPEWRERREVADRLKTDPDARRAAGEYLGGRIESRGVVKGVVCPSCGRPSLWWPLVPNGPGKALCEHQNSCGATFFLDELIERGGGK